MEIFQNVIIESTLTIITAIISFVSLKIKNIYKEYIDSETKKKIVSDTVKYVEQVTKDISISSENKKKIAKTKILEWFKEKNIKISDTQLDILIESAVNSLKETIK